MAATECDKNLDSSSLNKTQRRLLRCAVSRARQMTHSWNDNKLSAKQWDSLHSVKNWLRSQFHLIFHDFRAFSLHSSQSFVSRCARTILLTNKYKRHFLSVLQDKLNVTTFLSGSTFGHNKSLDFYLIMYSILLFLNAYFPFKRHDFKVIFTIFSLNTKHIIYVWHRHNEST